METNTGMLDRMLEDYNKFSSTYKGYSKLYVWRKWIRS